MASSWLLAIAVLAVGTVALHFASLYIERRTGKSPKIPSAPHLALARWIVMLLGAVPILVFVPIDGPFRYVVIGLGIGIGALAGQLLFGVAHNPRAGDDA